MNQSISESQHKEPLYIRATGKLPYTLTNDYMFKALLQKNETVLKHLICSLLRLRLEEIRSVEVKNPILLGTALTEDFDSKTFILDINVLLNNHTLINLEMQVADYKNWPERSMTYLCRNFDQLQSGHDYVEVKPTIHIGFLDFTLFPEHPEFYATYKMMNVKTHHIFTDKIALSVVNLKYIDMATQEDREWETDHWASLFKATTWEELKMLAERNQVMGEAVNTIYELTADEAIREQCKAREKHIKEMNTILKEREMAERARDAVSKQLEQAEQQLEQKDQQIARLLREIQLLKGTQD
ncbi:MAG: Rpn family recombination-promoting nuclease/putative transposase [bacterium]|nr:Rpn family recombination-promoting nuclease/putative transposase [bacterium]MCM1375396.1 Rpn family recombination-promoting nuclease/putative transposase [Muribaculum sp.]